MSVNANVLNFVASVATKLEEVGFKVSINVYHGAIAIESEEVNYQFNFNVNNWVICQPRNIDATFSHMMSNISAYRLHYLYDNDEDSQEFEDKMKQKYDKFISRLKKWA